MKRVDLSRLVSLDLSPSEARDLAVALQTFQTLAVHFEAQRSPVLDGVIERIHLQLEELLWPQASRRKAPFPV